MTAHINTIKMMEDELKSLGSRLTQAKIEERILSTLPPSLRTARDSWETQHPGELRTLPLLIARIVLLKLLLPLKHRR